MTFSNLNSSDKIQFSSFILIKEIGSGAFGKVFLARLHSDGNLYALKALRKSKLIPWEAKKVCNRIGQYPQGVKPSFYNQPQLCIPDSSVHLFSLGLLQRSGPQLSLNERRHFF